jgi:hypothetical protein
MCASAIALAGCGTFKELGSRHRPATRGTPPSAHATTPAEQSFRGLDLTTAPCTADPSALPDVWEERPLGSGSYELRTAVKCVYSGLDGVVYYVPDRNCWYVQRDAPGSSTLTFYGPFAGDPAESLDLKPSDESAP